jgi:Tfp pilus assembly protein PilP
MKARGLLIGCLLISGLACEEESYAPVDRVDPKKKSGSTGAELNITKAPKGRFLYREEGLKDPFQPFIMSFSDSSGKDTCPLCVPIAQLKFVGLVTGIASPRALIETDDGVGHILTRGAAIGSKGGRVVHIGNGRVLIRERLQDQLGRIQIVERSMILRSDDQQILQTTDDADDDAEPDDIKKSSNSDDDQQKTPKQSVNDLIKNSEAPTDDL